MPGRQKKAERRSAGIIVYDVSKKKPRVLLLHYAAGHWGFPKGHVEEGETLQQAALRELYEEAGVQAAIEHDFAYTFCYLVQYPGLPEQLKEVTLFVGVLTTSIQHVALSHEHKDYAWLPYSEAFQRLTYKNAKEALVCADRWLNQNKS